MIQKIIKVGNSFAVTIPKWFIDEAKIKDNQTVSIKTEVNDLQIVLDFGAQPPDKVEEIIDPEVYQVAKIFSKDISLHLENYPTSEKP